METAYLIDKLKLEFNFVEKYNLRFDKEVVLNQDFEDSISIRLITNENNSREIYLTLYPREKYKITFGISNTSKEIYGLIDIDEYLNFKLGNPPQYVPIHELDKNNFDTSLKVYAKEVEYILDTDLSKVIKGEEWVDIPSYDPRDQSNNH